ncbi:MAG: hypothetical protein ACI4TX_03485 [Christensenellales bacterium]
MRYTCKRWRDLACGVLAKGLVGFGTEGWLALGGVLLRGFIMQFCYPRFITPI